MVKNRSFYQLNKSHAISILESVIGTNASTESTTATAIVFHAALAIRRIAICIILLTKQFDPTNSYTIKPYGTDILVAAVSAVFRELICAKFESRV